MDVRPVDGTVNEMPETFAIIDPSVDANVAADLIALAVDQIGGDPQTIRVGITDNRSSSSMSITALVVGPKLAAVAEARLRAGEWLPVSTQTFRRSTVLEVVASRTEVWGVLDVAQVNGTETTVQIEGPVISFPPGTRAFEVLD